MVSKFTLKQKHRNILITHLFMDTMRYSQVMLMAYLISKWENMAFGGAMVTGGLELMMLKDRMGDLHIMQQIFLAQIS